MIYIYIEYGNQSNPHFLLAIHIPLPSAKATEALWHLLKANWPHVRPSSLYVGSMLRLFHLLGNRFRQFCLFQEHRKYTFLDQHELNFVHVVHFSDACWAPCQVILQVCCAIVARMLLFVGFRLAGPRYVHVSWSRPGCLPVLMPAGRKRRRGFGSAGLAG